MQYNFKMYKNNCVIQREGYKNFIEQAQLQKEHSHKLEKKHNRLGTFETIVMQASDIASTTN